MSLPSVTCILGLLVAGWGHLVTHEILGMARAWRSLDDRFPESLRTDAAVGGAAMLGLGVLLVASGMATAALSAS